MAPCTLMDMELTQVHPITEGTAPSEALGLDISCVPGLCKLVLGASSRLEQSLFSRSGSNPRRPTSASICIMRASSP